ncbi:MAG: hypothetical protein ISR65_18745 [Bacteriovoracaceae bacterium]|nr:hypothetical protein [Bacteriovoracaceae bacterium]
MWSWRKLLVGRAKILVKQLWKAGVTEIFLDGSFVENKDYPNDIDGYFDPCFSMYDFEDMKLYEKMISKLNDLDPHKVWDWSPDLRKPYRGYTKMQLPMWHIYRVEFYPHLSQGTGITDQFGFDMQFPSAFRQSRNNFQPKGIIKIIP